MARCCFEMYNPQPMETLNVGSGQTNEDAAAAQAAHLEELRGDVAFAGNMFFVAAACVLVCSGLLLVRFNLLIDVAAIEFAFHYAAPQMPLVVGNRQLTLLPQPPLVCSVAVLLILGFVVLGFFGRRGKRWAFVAGLAIYGLDAIGLLLLFSIFSFGVHGFFLFKWWQAQNAAAELAKPH